MSEGFNYNLFKKLTHGLYGQRNILYSNINLRKDLLPASSLAKVLYVISKICCLDTPKA